MLLSWGRTAVEGQTAAAVWGRTAAVKLLLLHKLLRLLHKLLLLRLRLSKLAQAAEVAAQTVVAEAEAEQTAVAEAERPVAADSANTGPPAVGGHGKTVAVDK